MIETASALRSDDCDAVIDDPLSPEWADGTGIASLVARKAWNVAVRPEMHLGRAPLGTARFVALLRAALSDGVRLDWRGCTTPGLSPGLCHLTPPSSVCSHNEDGQLETWIAAHRYGMFFWRQGPGFVVIKDQRPEGAPARFVIGDQPFLDVFHRALVPTAREELAVAPAAEAALTRLVSEGIVLETGPLVIALPYRMRRWPIPAFSV